MVSIGKVSFSAKCLFGRIGGLKKFREKKKDFGFEIFHIFYAKKRPFFPIFGPPPLFLGRRPEKKIGISLKFLHQKKISGRVPPNGPPENSFFFEK